MSAVLLSRLKIVDLWASTALSAGRRILPEGHALTRLVREELFLFEPARGVPAQRFEAPLAHAIETSNFFVNPNKELYRFLTASSRGETLAPPEGAWGLLTRARDETRDEGLRERLQREHPLEGLGAIRRGRIWWLWTRGPDGGPGVEACHGALGILRGRSQGLLVNPHSEAELRIEGRVSWAAVESFLTAPAPALEPVAGES